MLDRPSSSRTIRFGLLGTLLGCRLSFCFETPLQRKYRLALGLAPTFGQQDLKRAYRRKAQKQHPDKCRSEDSEKCHKAFVFLAEAYEALMDKPRHSRSRYHAHPRRPPEATESTKFTNEYAAKREARMQQNAEKARLRATEAAAALERAALDAKRVEEEAIKKREEERKVEQKEHDGWVKGQNEFWDKWTERQKKKEEREKRRLELLEIARKEAAAAAAAMDDDAVNDPKPVAEQDEIMLSTEPPAQNSSDNISNLDNTSNLELKNTRAAAPKSKSRKKFNLEDALRIWRSAGGDVTRGTEL